MKAAVATRSVRDEARRSGADEIVSVEAALMGGTVGIHLRPAPGWESAVTNPAREAARTLRAIGTWAGRLTRFDPASELSRLNADPSPNGPVGPTLAAVLDWGRAAEVETNGLVNIAMLAQRLDAELGSGETGGDRRRRAGSLSGPVEASNAWSLERSARGATVHRPAGLRFDLDGVAKGWLADRALARLARHAAAIVDADGDLAIGLGPGESWDVGVVDLLDLDRTVATLRLRAPGSVPASFGVATSGTSVHRWTTGDRPTHHLIDPRTGRPAATDVVQATVVAASARRAEAFAKAAVILGSTEALAAFDRPGIDGLILVTERRELLATPPTLRWLA